MRTRTTPPQRQTFALSNMRGFTLVELLVVMVIISVLAGLSTVNLISPQQAANLTGATEALVTDLRSQQIKAMSGDRLSTSGNAQPQGVYFASDHYELFNGTTYSAGDPNNFTIQPDGITFNTTLSGSQLSFQRVSGEPANFSSSANTITISNTAGESHTLTINQLGVVLSN